MILPHTLIHGIEMYYEVHGTGQPLLLIAGLASDSQSWKPVLGDLRKNYTVIIFDNRGCGRTRPMDCASTIADMADDSLSLLTHLGIQTAHLLGHSMGGFIAMECAIRHPERVKSLILAATSSCNSQRNNDLLKKWSIDRCNGMALEQWFMNLFPWLFTDRFLQDQTAMNSAMQFAVHYPYQQSAEAFSRQAQAITAFNRTSDLAKIAVPVLVMAGQYDRLFAEQVGRELAAPMANAEFKMIKNAAHSIHVEQPQIFVRAVDAFLKDKGNFK
ncbi:MAG: alpha/beta hydrolase [Nitrospirota bacterium]